MVGGISTGLDGVVARVRMVVVVVVVGLEGCRQSMSLERKGVLGSGERCSWVRFSSGEEVVLGCKVERRGREKRKALDIIVISDSKAFVTACQGGPCRHEVSAGLVTVTGCREMLVCLRRG